ncbi:hypothetical protein Pmar_PMAR020580 [Perkinsus marinus ATCC 50983]|uniref:N-acetyltransferase domain-containing protein n=1 Tax=Perkinsus marinus (strain ATCC 50983 / TXsc) TaxID=423536 RepID=C5L7F3_PERM5|nr:hypothetical protein Pmar_PMAR020580 [Perkinsus marinus ATCC 50983]EER07415.1 hypothetical protein Pmar_PMAR020580 [Perkinsus marinus ATCC 50983]|eukprot:XP_002775599.1 hypothetical protein Pmar_PMAR020580 [Perkinsus marinus ATCC 50983]
MSILMAPLVVHGLTSYKEGLSLDQLEYRLAKPSDVPLCDRVQPKAGLYVAVEPRGNSVVASVEFGLVDVPEQNWVYLPYFCVKEDWKGSAVGGRLLKRLLVYVHSVRPQVESVSITMGTTNDGELAAAEEAGFDSQCEYSDFKRSIIHSCLPQFWMIIPDGPRKLIGIPPIQWSPRLAGPVVVDPYH